MRLLLFCTMAAVLLLGCTAPTERHAPAWKADRSYLGVTNDSLHGPKYSARIENMPETELRNRMYEESRFCGCGSRFIIEASEPIDERSLTVESLSKLKRTDLRLTVDDKTTGRNRTLNFKDFVLPRYTVSSYKVELCANGDEKYENKDKGGNHDRFNEYTIAQFNYLTGHDYAITAEMVDEDRLLQTYAQAATFRLETCADVKRGQ